MRLTITSDSVATQKMSLDVNNQEWKGYKYNLLDQRSVPITVNHVSLGTQRFRFIVPLKSFNISIQTAIPYLCNRPNDLQLDDIHVNYISL